MEWRLGLAFDETATAIKRAVPWDGGKSAQRDRAIAAASGFCHRRFDERAAETGSPVLGENGQLLEMRVPVRLQNVDKSNGIRVLDCRNDEDEAAHGSAGDSVGRERPFFGLQVFDEKRVRGVLDIRQPAQVAGIRESHHRLHCSTILLTQSTNKDTKVIAEKGSVE